MKIAYLLKKFPRLSETFVLGEMLGQEALGSELFVFSRRAPDDEPRHPELARLKAEVEELPATSGMQSWLEIFRPDPTPADLPERMARCVRDFAGLDHPRLPMLFAEALYLLRRTRELGIEHVHTHFATDSALTAMLLEALGGPGYSVTAHAKDIYRSTVDARTLDLIVARSRFTVTVCDANVRHLEGLLSPDAMTRVKRIYNGIDLEGFRFVPEGRAPAHVLSIGRLVEKKGFGVLLDALADLRGRGVELTASLIGDGEERERLARRIVELGLDGRVDLMGACDQSVVRAEMERASVFCLPCLIGEDGNRDALPTVLLEALASGVPIVSTPVTGIPEIVDHGRVGRLVPENDPAATADALAALLSNPAERSALAQRGRRHAERFFERAAAARVLAACFEEARSHALCA